MSPVKAVIAGGLLLCGVALAVTLSHSPIAVSAMNFPVRSLVLEPRRGLDVCQSGETLPRGTSAIRLRILADVGPRVTLEVFEHNRVIARGEQASGWIGGAVTVPVRAPSVSRSPVTVCFRLFLNGKEAVELLGQQTSRALAARSHGSPLSGRLSIEYLRPSHSSWLSLAPQVARRMGLGRAASGTWSVVLVVVLMAGVALLSARVLLRELG